MPSVNIGVLISGGGTNLQALIDNINNGTIHGQIKLIISNREDAYGLKRGNLAGIESIYIDPKKFSSMEQFNHELIKRFKEKNIDLIVLAGYLKILSKEFIKSFPYIINIHPSLIPSFCGMGYYGERVHEEVLRYGVKYTGATVHFVDEGTDTGPIISQEVVPVYKDDTVSSLQKRVLEAEHKLLVRAVKSFCEDKISIVDRRVLIEGE